MNLYVSGRLPGLNEIIGGQNRGKNGWNSYNAAKQTWYSQIKLLCQAKHIPLQDPTHVTFLFVEPSRARDPDNVCSGGIKILLDSFVGAEVLSGDGWASILGLQSYWLCRPKQAGCLVHFSPDRTLTKPEMLAILEREKPDAH